MRRIKRNMLGEIGQQILMAFFVFSAFFPLYFMCITAFKSKTEYVQLNKFGLPLHPTFESFTEAIRDGQFFIWFMNTTIMTIGSVFISTIVSCFAAYAFSRMKFLGRDVIFNAVISLLMIPVVVVITPLFVFIAHVGLVNSRPATILIYAGVLTPFAIYLLNNFFLTIPQSIIDAASIDGCSDFEILWKIIFPMSRPAIIALTIINSVFVWNELLIALVFLQSDSLKTLMAGISTFKGLYNVNIPAVMAGIFLATLPMIMVYVVGQKHFIKGMLAGSLAGQ